MWRYIIGLITIGVAPVLGILPPVIIDKGQDYVIYQPFTSHHHAHHSQLISPPEVWIKQYSKKVSKLKIVMDFAHSTETMLKARHLYLEVLLNLVTGLIFGDEDVAAIPVLGVPRIAASNTERDMKINGLVWPGFGVTMVGEKRLRNIHLILREVFLKEVPGDYIETGVWRGGAAIYARAVMRAYQQSKERQIFVCDSFSGLPPSTLREDKQYGNWDHTPYTEVSDSAVLDNFVEHGVTDDGIVIVKGFFNSSLQPLANHFKQLAVIRFDGDMYEAAVDMLYILYDKLSIGGFVIMDDWYGFPSKEACEDFFAMHNMQPHIIQIDQLSAYWQKTEEVDIQKWRYEKKEFK